METQLVVELMIGMLWTVALASGPALLVVLVVGLVLGVLQSATQINESSVVFVPKLVALLLVGAVAGPFMLQVLLDYVRELLGRIPQIVS